ncbi:MAG: hypothetical protein NT062_11620 [Proteobacteria bacterium]|nr:hypothetical protein [Pseudomonadota bacterium]
MSIHDDRDIKIPHPAHSPRGTAIHTMPPIGHPEVSALTCKAASYGTCPDPVVENMAVNAIGDLRQAIREAKGTKPSTFTSYFQATGTEGTSHQPMRAALPFEFVAGSDPRLAHLATLVHGTFELEVDRHANAKASFTCSWIDPDAKEAVWPQLENGFLWFAGVFFEMAWRAVAA